MSHHREISSLDRKTAALPLIKNKQKRGALYAEISAAKNKARTEERKRRVKEREALGEKAPPKKVARTIENTREADDTMVVPGDEEVLADEHTDEFAGCFEAKKEPRILITTNVKPHMSARKFASELEGIIPGAKFYERKGYELKKIIGYCKEKEFTDIFVINEDRDKVNGLVHCHLPDGPTAFYKLTNLKLNKEIVNHTKNSKHRPELILNNFNTRLGHTLGRMLAAVFPAAPQFEGRRVITFHNQRDFIFFRHHRYVFDINRKKEEKTKARIQEIGPRFTLKLRALQHGTFDTKTGEYEWVHKTSMDTSRRRFFL
eukprot:TRINITY_DN4898_c0_g1_i3.p1 TRINITY_DN4898_c0_g1~~TRINITY_DN4898_c0_g1_i3.p1  ORF type:complete len:317 (-),score=60.55 TRINITY_DN4898_c0_g1_i3:12-962(-)